MSHARSGSCICWFEDTLVDSEKQASRNEEAFTWIYIMLIPLENLHVCGTVSSILSGLETTLKDFKNAKKQNSFNLLISCASISLIFSNNNYQYISKICFKFHIKIMNKKRVTAYHIAKPLDFKVAINSSIADMSWDRGGLSSTKLIFAA